MILSFNLSTIASIVILVYISATILQRVLIILIVSMLVVFPAIVSTKNAKIFPFPFFLPFMSGR